MTHNHREGHGGFGQSEEANGVGAFSLSFITGQPFWILAFMTHYI